MTSTVHEERFLEHIGSSNGSIVAYSRANWWRDINIAAELRFYKFGKAYNSDGGQFVVTEKAVLFVMYAPSNYEYVTRLTLPYEQISEVTLDSLFVGKRTPAKVEGSKGKILVIRDLREHLNSFEFAKNVLLSDHEMAERMFEEIRVRVERAKK